MTVQNILGAGDAFGAGFLYGYVKGWDLRKAARLGNACGAMVVSPPRLLYFHALPGRGDGLCARAGRILTVRNGGNMKNDFLSHFDLNGKVAAITGGGGDLCGAMAEALGAMGVKVAVLDIDLKKAEARSPAVTGSGGTARALRCDVLDRGQVRECYEEICSLWGPPDFLINGAGGNDPRGTTSEEFHNPAGSPDPATQSFFDLDPDRIPPGV